AQQQPGDQEPANDKKEVDADAPEADQRRAVMRRTVIRRGTPGQRRVSEYHQRDGSRTQSIECGNAAAGEPPRAARRLAHLPVVTTNRRGCGRARQRSFAKCWEWWICDGHASCSRRTGKRDIPAATPTSLT